MSSRNLTKETNHNHDDENKGTVAGFICAVLFVSIGLLAWFGYNGFMGISSYSDYKAEKMDEFVNQPATEKQGDFINSVSSQAKPPVVVPVGDSIHACAEVKQLLSKVETLQYNLMDLQNTIVKLEQDVEVARYKNDIDILMTERKLVGNYNDAITDLVTKLAKLEGKLEVYEDLETAQTEENQWKKE